MEQFLVKPLIPIHVAGYDISFTNQSLWMCIVVGAILSFMLIGTARRSLVPTRLQSMTELSYELVEGMIHSTAGEAGMKFLPLIFSIFLFVLCSNYFGLIPLAYTVTSQLIVTFALAALVILTVIVVGFMQHGLGFLKLFVPKAPLIMVLLLMPIEIVSFLSRPFSLSIRLFANMLAGHALLKVFAAFVVGLIGAGGILIGLSIAPMLLLTGVMALEFLIAILQAYVFAILSCIYLNEALHLHDHH
jgi:F-type H+-transporting ATPase subunit a